MSRQRKARWPGKGGRVLRRAECRLAGRIAGFEAVPDTRRKSGGWHRPGSMKGAA